MFPIRSPRRPKPVRLAVGPLETRDAPATLVGATKVTYQDADGDAVSVVFSTPVLNTGNVNSVFIFGTGTVNGSNAAKQQLRAIDLSGFGGAAGTTITLTATRSTATGGDGFAALGQIDANGVDLGAVSIDGDLGRIIAGDSTTSTSGLKALTVQSMGRFGLSTQAAGGDLNSAVVGTIGSLMVKGDMVGASVLAQGTGAGIGSVRVGGSVLGAGVNQGGIFADGAIGSVLIGGDVRGGNGDSSGRIGAGRLGPVTVGGSLIGGGGANSGLIRAFTGDIGLVKIGGGLLGGADQFAGSIVTTAGKIAGVTVAGSLVGGTGVDSASIFATGALGPVKIGGDVRGSPVIRSAVVQSNASVSSVTVGGSLIGGAQNAGTIGAGSTLGPVTIGGSVRGGNGQGSGGIFATTGMGLVRITGDLLGGAGIGAGAILSFGKLAGVAVGGSVAGGAGPLNPAQIYAGGDMGPVAIAGDLRGAGADTGNIVGDASTASITIGGSLVGGAANSGRITRVVNSGNVGPVAVKGDVIAGSGANSGQISVSNGNVAAVTIGGSLVGGLDFSGMVQVSGITGGNLGPVKIGGDAIGGSGTNSGSVLANNIGAVTVLGALRGGGGTDSGAIRSQGSIGAVRIGRDVTGSTNTDTGRIAAATGPIASVTVGGSLVGGFFNRTGEIFSGGNLGPVTIGGDIRGGSAFGLSSLDRSGYVQGKNIAGVAVGGSIVSGSWDGPPGTLTKSGSVRADERLGPVTVKGSLTGNSGAPVIIAARGLTAATGALAIRGLRVGGRVEFAQILAGYNSDLVGQNGDAQIGTVLVGRDWIASSIAAGVLAINGLLGDADDAPLFPIDDGIVSRIASITIRGAALGTVGGGDHYGFAAQQIGSLTVGGTAYPLTVGAGNDLAGLAVGATGDLRVWEVAV